MSDTPIGESLAAISQFFVGDHTVEETLGRVADLAVEAIDPADLAGMTMLIEGRERTGVFTDPDAVEIDQAQYDTGDGPCLHAFHTGEAVWIRSTAADGPFPAFRAAAAAHGMQSTLSLPMVAADVSVGALNLYSKELDGFSAADERTGATFARHAAVVLVNTQAYWDAHTLSSRMQEAMEFRAIIEQAKGILMAAQRCSADEAFDLLVAASQRENVKLRVIAQRIVDRTAADQIADPTDGATV